MLDLDDALRAPEIGRQRIRQHQHADDLAKAQRRHGEIVAAHPQHRQAEQHTGAGGQHHRHRQRHPERHVDERQRAGRAHQRDRIGADREEGDEAEIDQARKAELDVEPHAHQHVERDQHGDLGDEVVGDQRQNENAHQQHSEPDLRGARPTCRIDLGVPAVTQQAEQRPGQKQHQRRTPLSPPEPKTSVSGPFRSGRLSSTLTNTSRNRPTMRTTPKP